MLGEKQFKGIVLWILGRWRQSNAQDATAKNLQKSSGSIDRGNLGAIALNAERRGKEYKKTKIVDKKSEIQEVFDHVYQLLTNDLFLDNYFMLTGKHKDRVMIEIPVDNKTEQTNYFFLYSDTMM